MPVFLGSPGWLMLWYTTARKDIAKEETNIKCFQTDLHEKKAFNAV